MQDYLATCGCYRSASYAQWEPEDKADPWLIAAAKVLHATIVTNEQAVKPTRNQPLKREPKIPDVAEALGVRKKKTWVCVNFMTQVAVSPIGLIRYNRHSS